MILKKISVKRIYLKKKKIDIKRKIIAIKKNLLSIKRNKLELSKSKYKEDLIQRKLNARLFGIKGSFYSSLKKFSSIKKAIKEKEFSKIETNYNQYLNNRTNKLSKPFKIEKSETVRLMLNKLIINYINNIGNIEEEKKKKRKD